jgi:integral membrane protein
MAAAITRFRIVSLLEAITFLVLLGFVYNEQVLDGSHTGISIMGPTHGTLVIFYVLLALDLKVKLGWSGATLAKVVVACAVPFAPFFVERWVRTQAPSGARA